MVHLVILIISIYLFIKTISYGIYEVKTEQNKIAGISVITLSIVICLSINVITFLT